MIRDYIDSQFSNDEIEEVGIGGFKTFATISEKVSRSRQSPTTYLEDGQPVQDHIIRDPMTIKIDGEVSDVFVGASSANEFIRDALPQVGSITQFLPSRTQSQISRITALTGDISSAVSKIDGIVSASQQVSSFLGYQGNEGKSNIESFIDTMDGIYASDTLISIDAPFRTYKNMSMAAFDYERDSTTSSLRFTLELIEFRFSESVFVEVKTAAKNPSSANGGAQDSASNKGVQEGKKVESFLSKYLGGSQ